MGHALTYGSSAHRRRPARLGQRDGAVVGWFSKGKTDFWNQAPLRPPHEPELLYAHGINCVMQDRYEEMIATGFVLLSLGGPRENQADDFVRDGYRGWRESPQFDNELAATLLAELIDSVGARDFALSCWALMARMDLLTGDELLSYEHEAYRRIAAAPSRGHVPFAAAEWVARYAKAHRIPAPW